MTDLDLSAVKDYMFFFKRLKIVKIWTLDKPCYTHAKQPSSIKGYDQGKINLLPIPGPLLSCPEAITVIRPGFVFPEMSTA